MSRLLALVAVAVIAFACALRPPTVAPAEPPGEAADADEPDIVPYSDPEDPGLTNINDLVPDLDRLDKWILDATISADHLGPPDDSMGGTLPPSTTPYSGRMGPIKSYQLRYGGGNAESERAIARGLTWLACQQKQDGGCEFDQRDTADRVAATGFVLLTFLAAGQTHKPRDRYDEDESKYKKNVAAGLDFLMKNCSFAGPRAGRFENTTTTGQVVATHALCDAYGLTSDPILKPYAQAAINYLQKVQGPNGSWGDAAGTDGDIFAAGWALQALHAGRLARDLVVDDRVIKKAGKFLDRVSAGSRNAMFGVVSNADAKPGTTPTAIGLLCRHTFDGWGPNHPGMVDGVAGLAKNPPSDANRDPVYLYYATQVLYRFGGGDWKEWNEGLKSEEEGIRKGGVRNLLVKSQLRKDGANLGSWEPGAGAFGTRYGRLGTTALTVLTLETYYRHPAPKPGTEGR